MTLRVLIVDDEALARERLRTLLAREGGVEVVGECAGGAQAVDDVARLRPDVVFLDVQMPEVDGFDVVAQLGPACPAVVFATAYDEFALRAFDANAVDYLLKPIGADRLHVTLERARARAGRPAGEQLGISVDALVEAAAGDGRRERLSVRTGNRIAIVRTADVVRAEAADNYVRLWTRRGEHLYRATMSEMMVMLGSECFVRIHRSTIVNVNEVEFLEPWGLGEYQFVLTDGTRLLSSRRYRQSI
ncbi:LytTR family DNA-binding domain-containing protein, partial [Longimicrobium sp.]|uniref:LytR/AlgR family response regulator transcription factor n=1 Tax=Longimicrobium sp. TaxID=2029185 RepID=UPI002E334FA8